MSIVPITPTHVASIIAQDGGNGWNRDERHWSDLLRQVELQQRVTLVAVHEGHVVGYGSLLWRSSYPGFATAGIPELHDLATDTHHRGRGIATSLIAALEALARQAGHTRTGLGVGLYRDYGPAQRLYVRLGYMPDGNGITYRHEPVVPGAASPVDDDLLLWLTRQL
jgi:GNAT superfamily N-acetyltransferase